MILIVGASGLLGSNLAFMCSLRGLPFHGTYLQHAMVDARNIFSRRDLRTPEEVQTLFRDLTPDVVINCSAYTNIDQAERAPTEAYAVNAELPSILAEESKSRRARFIHISTDGIFDGEGIPNNERDRPKPANVYAKSKLSGEEKVLLANPDALIIRTCIYGWSCGGRESLAEWILHQLHMNRSFIGFTDAFFNPQYVGMLSDFILDLGCQKFSGILNLGSRDSLTKFDFALALAEEFGLNAALVKPGKLLDVPFVARRPNYTVLDCTSAEKLLNRAMPTAGEGIHAMRLFKDRNMWQQLKRWGNVNGDHKNW